MSALSFFDSTACHHLTLALGHFVWQGAMIALIAGGMPALLFTSSARLRYAIHLCALLGMGVCLPVTFLIVSGGIASGGASPATTAESAKTSWLPMGVAGPSDFAGPGTATQAVTSSWLEASPMIAAAYVFGMTLMWLRLAVAVHGGQRLRRHAVPLDDDELNLRITHAARRLGLRRAPAVAFCRLVTGPLVVGWIRPMVLIPVTFGTGLSPSQLQAILIHELAHIRRYDPLVLMLQRTVESLLFFHPAVWYVSRQLSVEREHCCDDAVLTSGADPRSYAEALLHLAELGSGPDRRPLALGTLAATGRGKSRLRQRIARVLSDDTEPSIRMSRGGVFLILFAMSTFVLAPPFLQTWAQRRDNDSTPSNRVTGEAKLPPQLKISIAPDGVMAVDGQVIPPAKMISVLRDAASRGVKEAVVTEDHKPGQAHVVSIAILIALHTNMVVPDATGDDVDKKSNATKSPATRVTISRSGGIKVDGKATELEQFRKLKLAGKSVIVSVDPAAENSRLVAVLDALRAAGATPVKIATAVKPNWQHPVEVIPLPGIPRGSYLRFPENVERAMIGDALQFRRLPREDGLYVPQEKFVPTPQRR